MKERRVEPRLLCSELVRATWKEKSGRGRTTAAVLEDISRTGLCLQFEHPVPIGTLVTIVHRRGRLHGHVCHCSFRDIGYYVGLRLDPNSPWDEDAFHPAHLLDVRKLKPRAQRPGIGGRILPFRKPPDALPGHAPQVSAETGCASMELLQFASQVANDQPDPTR